MKKTRADGGYTMVELLVAMVMAGAVASIVSVTVANGLQISSIVNDRAVNQVTVNKALDGMGINVALADPIEQIAPNALTMKVSRPGVCERHKYSVLSNTNTVSGSVTYTLEHAVQEKALNTNETCASIDGNVWLDPGLTPTIDREELVGLVPNADGTPFFTYYSTGNTKIAFSGAGANLALSCAVGRVEVVMTVQDAKTAENNIVRTQMTPRSATLGLIC